MIPPIRIGQGYDIHPFQDGRPMVLGGVTFDTPYGLEGHSDADVLTHAICDALLGAAGLPDIGHFFPNTDPKYKGINSQELLKEVAATLRQKGWDIVNIDTAMIAEKPKIYPQLDNMKKRLAASAGIDPAQIGIKATTNEKIGSLGRAEGIAAHASALICKQ
ncbi:2-C-methyl-D-erythritol 2,4-cyclodiphosphate synthase [Pelagicoccus sp. SDUM812002]|uniref:2-C-methyl-D-erythritol 2,4-cyclodiphosphate synthase n=1 Tax=Pelagicoccus sp. SDUM812002 TaxID=3041266 RepID=UPI00280DF929|nr:2-C-methyl-D-erythritol 2,4-cyclodiphosphate synthase [Pelagicoccus sp. SDUM812002]MDQ8187983.1 2-C-methyl-D-erythritol 2,4-cyclodiphosphate synthase [Pelagicoccus sp. SDUM812002]